jgi:predicted nucleotidyltransferase
MPTNALLPLLQQRLPGLLAVYAFGSRVKQGGAQARADSDLDLAVLVEGRADPVLLFELMGELTDVWLGSKKSMLPTPPRSLSISAGKTPPF